MADIEFNDNEKDVIVQQIKRYFLDELDQEIAQFDAEFLLDFFAKQIGPYFYNRGLYDAQALLTEKMEHITDSLYEIEKPTAFVR